MNKLFELANQYIKKCDWKDLALLKFCLCAVGVIIGLAVPKKNKKCILGIACTVFLITYIPLMKKFIQVIISENKKNAN